jgi:hypothetical protein
VIAFIIATASIAVGGYSGERKGASGQASWSLQPGPIGRGHHLAAQAQDSVAMTAWREVGTWQMNPS